MKPTLKRCLAAFGPSSGMLIFGLLNGHIKPESDKHLVFPKTDKWVNEFHPKPKEHDLILSACDEVLEGHGIECVNGRHIDSYFQDIQLCYSNSGDLYTCTVMHDNEKGEFLVGNVGTWIELNEKRRGLK